MRLSKFLEDDFKYKWFYRKSIFSSLMQIFIMLSCFKIKSMIIAFGDYSPNQQHARVLNILVFLAERIVKK